MLFHGVSNFEFLTLPFRRLCLLWLTDIVHTIQGMPADMQRKVAGIANLMDAVIVVCK